MPRVTSPIGNNRGSSVNMNNNNVTGTFNTGSIHQDTSGARLSSNAMNAREYSTPSNIGGGNMMVGNTQMTSSYSPFNAANQPFPGQGQSQNQNLPTTLTSTPNSVGMGMTPVKVSNIDNTRPTRNIFPANTYVEQTKIDENLIVVED